jgi:hypothetical protein
MKVKLIIQMIAIFLLFGCAAPKVNVVKNPSISASSIKKIALMPSGGILADSIGFELLKYGFDIIDTSSITNLMLRNNLTEIELIEPSNISKLATQGIDSVLLAKTISGYDNRPQSASVKLLSTQSGVIIAGATWQNGRGGAQGSPADQGARVDMVDAARQIADALGSELWKK